MAADEKNNHTMDNEGPNQNDLDGIESIKGDEVMDSLGVVESEDTDYVENDDVANSIARGSF